MLKIVKREDTLVRMREQLSWIAAALAVPLITPESSARAQAHWTLV